MFFKVKVLRLFSRCLMTSLVAGALTACGPSERPSASVLLERFWPTHRASLGRAEGELASRVGTLNVQLPARLDEPVVVTADRGDEWHVRERGCGAFEGTIDDARTYTCAWGSAVWSPTAAGVEEWLVLPDGAILRDTRPEWEVEGGRLVQHGRSIDVYDDADLPRATLSPLVAFDSTGRSIGVRLRAQGSKITLGLDERVDGPVLVDPSWVQAGAMGVGRGAFSLTELADGRVLATGGITANSGPGGSPTAETWDPATHTWSAVAPMSIGRTFHTGNLLLDKRVLVVAGDGLGTVSDAETYDPTTDKWSSAGKLGERFRHATISMPNGTVVVFGGSSYAPDYPERYDPVTNGWSQGAPLPSSAWPYNQGFACLLPNGRAFTFGNPPAGAGLYDPKNDTWTLPAAPATSPYAVSLATLGSGHILVAGGDVGFNKTVTAAQVYDPVADKWTQVAPLATPREYYTAASLPDGKAIVVGGCHDGIQLSSTEIYDEVANKWTAGPPLLDNYCGHQMVNLGTKLLVVDGNAPAELLSVVPDQPLGGKCGNANDCVSAFCVDGVCCDQKCSGDSQCEVCSAAKGATKDGTCTKLDNTKCDAKNLCTSGDHCVTGKCTAGAPKQLDCPNMGPCYEQAACDPKTGACASAAMKADGASCDDGDKCTQTDQCAAGACVGSNPLPCNSPPECRLAGACVPTLGTCGYANAADGTPCSGGTCRNGACDRPQAAAAASSGGGDQPAAQAGCSCRIAPLSRDDGTAVIVLLGLGYAARRSSRRSPRSRLAHSACS